jgi:maltooligosyltrehalose trehalohydrolase
MINMAEVGAFPTLDASGRFHVRFGVYLPGLQASNGFAVIVRVIHSQDRFVPGIAPCDFPLQWQQGSALDLWNASVSIDPVAGTNFGNEGTYLYRYQLQWAPAGQVTKSVVTKWFVDPFARATDIGELCAFTLTRTVTSFAWADDGYKTPELNDLIVYELHIAQFNDTFDGVIDQLDYLQSLGVNCLELMPVMSHKLDFDWGYGPLQYFSPSAHFGGADGLKRLVNTCHGRGMAVILDVVYQHVDPSFPYNLVYDDVAQTGGAPAVPSPMIGAMGPFGPQSDFSQTFTQEYFQASNQLWITEYHVDGFRYDEVTDYYFFPTDTAYSKLAYETYKFSLGMDRFRRAGSGYSRIIQCAEALYRARDVLTNTYTNAAWQDDLLNQSEDMIQSSSADQDFAHLLDVNWSGYPQTKTVVDDQGNPVEMPVSPFQYLESHDHSQLIVFTGTDSPDPLASGNRDNFYRLQPFAIALYTAQGIPMLWEGQEFADNYQLPGGGDARIGLRRDTHWEYFYDDPGSALIRLYRRLGMLRRNFRALRSRDSYFYYQQSLQGTSLLAYHRHAAADADHGEEFHMVLLNFGDSPGSIAVPFPKAGTYREMLDDDVRPSSFDLTVVSDGDMQTIIVPSHYGFVFVKTS